MRGCAILAYASALEQAEQAVNYMYTYNLSAVGCDLWHNTRGLCRDYEVEIGSVWLHQILCSYQIDVVHEVHAAV